VGYWLNWRMKKLPAVVASRINNHLILDFLQKHIGTYRPFCCSVHIGVKFSNSNTKRMRWAGHVACTEEERGVHRVLVGKPEGKSSLGRPRCRWEDNIKMDLQEVGCGGMD
jgi:hypothetical protein